MDHTQYETLSYIKTIEERFGLQPLTDADAGANSFAPAFAAAPTTPLATPTLAAGAAAGAQLALTWPAAYTGYVVQMETNLPGANWVTVYAGSSNTFNVSVDTNRPTAFYRLIHL